MQNNKPPSMQVDDKKSYHKNFFIIEYECQGHFLKRKRKQNGKKLISLVQTKWLCIILCLHQSVEEIIIYS